MDLFFEFLLNAASLPGMPQWIRVLTGVLFTLVFLVAVGALALYALVIPGPWPPRLVAGLFAVALVLGYGGCCALSNGKKRAGAMRPLPVLRAQSSSSLSTAVNASLGSCTLPS